MTLAACGPVSPHPAANVVATGQPAGLLIWAVARDRLAGWPRTPPPDALAALPALAANLPELGALGGGGRPANLEAMAALRPRLVIDYGDTDPGNRQLGDRMRDRLGVEWRLIGGALPRIPEAIREAAVLLDAPAAPPAWRTKPPWCSTAGVARHRARLPASWRPIISAPCSAWRSPAVRAAVRP